MQCPSCGTVLPHVVLYRKNGYDILRCEGCKLGRTQAPEFNASAYYTESYFNGGHDDGYFDYAGSETVLRKEFGKLLKAIMARTGIESGRLLEVGCAYGFFLLEARRHFEVHGIEISAEAVDYCHRSGLDTVAHGVPEPEFLASRGPFDIVVMLDVIEHLTDPEQVLTLLAQHLRPGGVLVLTTGDFASFAARRMGSGWRLMTPPQHLWFFTPKAIAGLARVAGLEVLHLDHPSKNVPFSLIAFQVARMLGLRAGHLPAALSSISVPLNLWDAMRVILRKPLPVV